jgi:transcriptional regulator NrdR family protein
MKRTEDCPKLQCRCGSLVSRVIRGTTNDYATYARTRECLGCGVRYVTAETITRYIPRIGTQPTKAA